MKSGQRRDLFTDPDVLETFIVSLVVCLLTLGTTLIAAWLRVLVVAACAGSGRGGNSVLVCGHRLDGGKVSRDYRLRLNELARILQSEPGTAGVLLGGGSPSEARVGLAYLRARHGVDPGRIRLEEASTDTLENLRHARELTGPGTRAEPLRLVSNRYHLARLKALSGSLGLDVHLHPADGRAAGTLGRLPATAVEAAFLCWFTTGRLWARLTGKHRMLARIR